MMTKTEKQFSFVFFIIVLLELIFSNSENLEVLHYATKPAIVVSLIIFFWRFSPHLNKSTKQLTILALIFSVIGDILLMFVENSAHYFTFGLVAFLLAHLMYVLVFLKKKNTSIKPYPFLILLLVYASLLLYVLKDGLGEMLIPVIIYMAIILLMATSAFLRKESVTNKSYMLVFVGALFFMLSDSILALNKFYKLITFSEFTIILTYAIAQYLIVLGILKQKN